MQGKVTRQAQRTTWLVIRMTRTDKKQLEQDARRSGQTLSEYVRALIHERREGMNA